MSAIIWCDAGGHPFSANDPDRAEYANTKVTNDRRERIDVCGEHVKSNAMGITQLGFGSRPVAVSAADADVVDDKS